MTDSGPLIGFVFDLDQTLAPDTTTQYLRARGVDVDAFWAETQERMRAGWDQVPAYLYGLVLEGQRGKSPVSRSEMEAVGRVCELYPGVADLVPRLRAALAERGASSEYYLISSGLAPIVTNLPIAAHFQGIWSSDFAYDEAGRPVFPRRVVSFTDKTRPLIEISKGISQAASEAEPFLVNERVESGGFRIPFRRMVFTGDGLTDVPCFAMVTARGGAAIAVYDHERPHAKEVAQGFLQRNRVRDVAVADYRSTGPAFAALLDAAEAIQEDAAA